MGSPAFRCSWERFTIAKATVLQAAERTAQAMKFPLSEERLWGFAFGLVILTAVVSVIVVGRMFSWPLGFCLELLMLDVSITGMVFSFVPPMSRDDLISKSMFWFMTATAIGMVSGLLSKRLPRVSNVLFLLMLAVQFFLVFPLLPRLWRRSAGRDGTPPDSGRRT